MSECIKCLYWWCIHTIKPDKKECDCLRGYCRRYPPAIKSGASTDAFSRVPQDGWCGEFKKEKDVGKTENQELYSYACMVIKNKSWKKIIRVFDVYNISTLEELYAITPAQVCLIEGLGMGTYGTLDLLKMMIDNRKKKAR